MTPSKEGALRVIRCVAGLAALYFAILTLAGTLMPLAELLLKSFHFNFPPERVFDRLRYVGVLLALPFLWSASGLRSWKELGWQGGPLVVIWAFAGMVLTWGLGDILAGTVSGVDIGAGKFLEVIGTAIASAAAVAFIEEILFRGILQTLTVRRCGTLLGIFIAALVYAFLHGKAVLPPEGAAEIPDWMRGLGLAWSSVGVWSANLPPLVFVNLVLLGCVLGQIYHRTGSLLPSMGLHFGIVATMLTVTKFARLCHPGLASDFILNSWPTLIIVATLAAAVALLPRKQKAA